MATLQTKARKARVELIRAIYEMAACYQAKPYTDASKAMYRALRAYTRALRQAAKS